MGMNLMNIMKQVQNAQKRAESVQKELAELEITGEAANGAVKVICDGQGKFKSIKIEKDVFPTSLDTDSIEMFEDIISTAMKQANEKASKEMGERMKQITGGIKIPGLNF